MFARYSAEWDSDDTINLRQFLKTRTGKRLAPAILDHIPSLLEGGETNAVLIRMGEVRGCLHCVNTITELAYPAKETERPTADTYPALDDDAAWSENQSTNPKPN